MTQVNGSRFAISPQTSKHIWAIVIAFHASEKLSVLGLVTLPSQLTHLSPFFLQVLLPVSLSSTKTHAYAAEVGMFLRFHNRAQFASHQNQLLRDESGQDQGRF